MYAGVMPVMNRYKKWNRIVGPIFSILLHVGLVVLLLHTLGFAARTKQDDVRIELARPEEIELDEILPLDPPEVTDDQSLNPEPLTAEDVASMTPPDDAVTDAFDQDISMLDNLSPLTIQGVGADLGSQGALTSRYGKRAVENGLLGSYFNRIDFTGETFMRIDETLNYDWATNSPWTKRINPEFFSIIWTGRIVPPRTGVYTLYLSSDDGARLWIDGELVLDQFTEHENTTYEVKKMMLVGKSYDIKYAFCEVTVLAVSKLEWSCGEAGIPRQLIPAEHMWADGKSTRQMLAWNEEAAGGQYGNRKLMRNPALIEGQAFSHIVNFKTLDEQALVRLGLPELINDLSSFRKSGRIPDNVSLPMLPPSMQQEISSPPAKTEDIKISIM